MADWDDTFPLVSRRRLVGVAFGRLASSRRGVGSDIAGSRPYRPGDDIGTIDWKTSARLSAARGSDEFVVREYFTEEAPRVVAVCDRRPAMRLYPPVLGWLSKATALTRAAELVVASTRHARGLMGYLDYGDVANPDEAERDPEPFWLPPRGETESELVEERLASPSFFAPADNLASALVLLGESRRDLPAGAFVFLLSDFLVPPPAELWVATLERRWEVVPVVIQDPTWEQSFPARAHSVLLPLADPADGRISVVRLSAKEARRRRDANEARLAGLVADFRSYGLEPILLGTSAPEAILEAFRDWAEQRVQARSVAV
jgi:hypothetical protein